MATNYTKSLSTDFGGSWNQSQFHSEIVSETGIIPTLLRTDGDGDNIKIWFDSSLSSGEQIILNNLVTAHVPIPIIGGSILNYDALVDAKGNGDFLLPSAAFAAGATTVYVRPGVYIETTDVIIPDNGVLRGETISPVIIYFAGLNNGVKIDGNGGVKETAGTISVTNNTNLVVGVGTFFTNLSPEQYILLDQNFYQIASITDNTNLLLTESYRGNTITNLGYIAQAMYTAVNICNVIITGSTGTGLFIRGVRSSTIETCGVMINGGIGLEITDCSTNAISSVNCYDNGLMGICFDNAYSIGLINTESYNNGDSGYCVKGNSNNIVFNGVMATNNNSNGIEVSGTASNILINDCTIKRNKGRGLYTHVGTGSAIIDGTMMSFNGGNGVEFAGDNNIISNCIINDNSGIGIHVGTNGTVTGNQIFNNGSIAIDMSGDDNCQISSNNIHSNVGDAIYMNGINNGISDNSIRNNGGKGIHINNGMDNDIDGNTVSDNTAEGLKMVGACNMTIIANNHFKNNSMGLDIPITSDDCVVNGNIFTNNAGHGIQIASNECIVTGNRCKNNTGSGCVVVTGATNNTIKINRFTGNTGVDFIDNGTTTMTDV